MQADKVEAATFSGEKGSRVATVIKPRSKKVANRKGFLFYSHVQLVARAIAIG